MHTPRLAQDTRDNIAAGGGGSTRRRPRIAAGHLPCTAFVFYSSSGSAVAAPQTAARAPPGSPPRGPIVPPVRHGPQLLRSAGCGENDAVRAEPGRPGSGGFVAADPDGPRSASERTPMILRAKRPQRRGTAIVETAVCMTLLIPLLIGLWEVGRLVEMQQLLSNAAREGGRQASTGLMNAAGVKQYVVDYLTLATNAQSKALDVTTADVTVTNLTSGKDPTAADQLDRINVTVTVPISRSGIRWILLNQITSVTQLVGTADWFSMRDSPLTINQ